MTLERLPIHSSEERGQLIRRELERTLAISFAMGVLMGFVTWWWVTGRWQSFFVALGVSVATGLGAFALVVPQLSWLLRRFPKASPFLVMWLALGLAAYIISTTIVLALPNVIEELVSWEVARSWVPFGAFLVLLIVASLALYDRLYYRLKANIQELERSQRRLQLLREIDRAILSSLNLDQVLEVFMERVLELVEVKGVAVLLRRGPRDPLALSAARGMASEIVDSSGRQAVTALGLRAMDEGEPILQTDRGAHGAWLGVPLVARGRGMGALVLSAPPERFSSDSLQFYRALANQTAIALDNAQLYMEQREARIDTLFKLASLSEARDATTGAHLLRVRHYMEALASALGLSREEAVEMGIAAITHDVGKIRLPEVLMTKPGALTEEEWTLMRQHPLWGAQILGDASFYRLAATVAEHHHERWDGTGYPHGLKGEAIPLAARIVSLADVYDALTTERPYKAAWPAQRARDYILEQRTKQFDPAVVDAFTAAWQEGVILRIQSRISL